MLRAPVEEVNTFGRGAGPGRRPAPAGPRRRRPRAAHLAARRRARGPHPSAAHPRPPHPGGHPAAEAARRERHLPAPARRRLVAPAREPAEVICHGDPAPCNYVVRNGEAVGLIDFDAARPGPRVRDVAYAIHRFAPLHGPDNPESFGTPREQGRRAAAFCRAYGPGVGAEVVDVVPERLRALIAFMRDRAAHGDEAFQRHLAEGHADAYEADIRHVRAHRAALRAAFEE
ncbi:phosphotransferase [Streptomyces koyangensis]